MSDDLTPHQNAQRKRMILAAVALAVGLVAMILFGPKSSFGETVKLNTGHMAAFVYKAEPAALPEVRFVDAAGKERTLKDWKGRVVLVNLWATWCAPCRKEMPDLDRLQAELGSDAFEVVAVSVDRSGVAGAQKFLDQVGTKKLALYADPTAKLASELKAIGLPATLLIGRDGREIGRLTGPAEWASDDAKRLIEAAVKAR